MSVTKPVIGIVRGLDDEHRVPVFSGLQARRVLLALWGLPNAAPSRNELWELGPLAYVRTSRVLFVDDDNQGAPRAIWRPEP